MKTATRITVDKISPDEIIKSVEDNAGGAVVLFLGTVRDFGERGKVEGMYYESYIAMAEESLKEIEDEVLQKWPIRKIRTIHRIGELTLGDTSIAVCISSSHRIEAFEACQYAIEKIKQIVPIWKRERLADGTRAWVAEKFDQ